MASLITTNGVRVTVSDEKVDRYLAAGGFRLADEAAKKTTARKASSKSEK